MVWGPLISAGASLASGLLGRSAAKDAAAQNQANFQQNIDLQKTFAKEGIRWKVEDAKKAGIHPLFALGAQTTSFAPQSISTPADNSVATAVANMGQDVGRAVNATRTSPERIEAKAATALHLESLQLDNQIKRATLASSVARLNQQTNPALPSGDFVVPEKTKAEERQPLMLDGSRIKTSPGTSPGNAWEDQLGDDVFSPGFLPNLVGMIKENTKGMSFLDILRAIDRKTAIWSK